MDKMDNLKLNLPHCVVIFDTETGGLNPAHEISWNLDKSKYELGAEITGRLARKPSPILEIGAVKLSPLNLKETESFHSLCGPEKDQEFDVFIKNCNPEALKVNGFKDRLDELREAPPTSEVLKNFLKWLTPTGSSRPEKFIPGGQNCRFDIDMVNMAFDRFSINYQIRTNPLELVSYSQLYFALPDSPTVANYKLTTVASALGISTEGAHTALADVRMTAACMRKIFARFSTP